MDETDRPRFVVYTGTIIYANRPDLYGHRESLWWKREAELTPFASKIRELEAQGYTVCQDPEEPGARADSRGNGTEELGRRRQAGTVGRIGQGV